jgi:hypothetical protein
MNISKVLGQSWMTNIISILTGLATVPSVITAVQQWEKHQAVDWRPAVVGALIAVGFALTKDFNVHSTADQVQTATATAQLNAKDALKP